MKYILYDKEYKIKGTEIIGILVDCQYREDKKEYLYILEENNKDKNNRYPLHDVWENEIIDLDTIKEKKILISKLLLEVNDILIDKFFDFTSDNLLDEKIQVLTDLKNGKTPSQIPMYNDILELYPGDNVHWD